MSRGTATPADQLEVARVAAEEAGMAPIHSAWLALAQALTWAPPTKEPTNG